METLRADLAQLDGEVSAQLKAAVAANYADFTRATPGERTPPSKCLLPVLRARALKPDLCRPAGLCGHLLVNIACFPSSCTAPRPAGRLPISLFVKVHANISLSRWPAG